MTPHLHPRSRSTASLFAATLFASFVVVGLPHLFPCPAPRRTLADSQMAVQQDQSPQPTTEQRRRRRDSAEPAPDNDEDSEVSTFLQLEAEAQKLSRNRRECPVPKPGAIIGAILGFTTGREQTGQGGRELRQDDRRD